MELAATGEAASTEAPKPADDEEEGAELRIRDEREEAEGRGQRDANTLGGGAVAAFSLLRLQRSDCSAGWLTGAPQISAPLGRDSSSGERGGEKGESDVCCHAAPSTVRLLRAVRVVWSSGPAALLLGVSRCLCCCSLSTKAASERARRLQPVDSQLWQHQPHGFQHSRHFYLPKHLVTAKDHDAASLLYL